MYLVDVFKTLNNCETRIEISAGHRCIYEILFLVACFLTINNCSQIMNFILQVQTDYAKRKGVIIVDGQETEAVNVSGDGSTLDVDGKLYLGGLPLGYLTKNIRNVRTLPSY